ncbi:MAG: hypothetical protein GF307_05175 [candidate division Zixibacteria bacterium]|nr:hypothetical protein [candidate division Zixibacteria bacterium]
MNFDTGKERIKAEFHRLFFPLMQEIYNITSLLFRSRRKSANLVEDTYSTAYREYLNNPSQPRPRLWLLSILNENYMKLNGSDNFGNSKIDADEFSKMMVDGKEIESMSNGGGTREIVNKGKEVLFDTLHGIPSKWRMAYLLNSIGELKYDEVGKVMNIPKEEVSEAIKNANIIIERSVLDRSDEKTLITN